MQFFLMVVVMVLLWIPAMGFEYLMASSSNEEYTAEVFRAGVPLMVGGGIVFSFFWFCI